MLNNRNKYIDSILNLFYIMVFILMCYSSFLNVEFYGVGVLITRITLCILILTFIVGVGSFKLNYMNLIGIGYIITNGIYIVSIFLLPNMKYIGEAVVIRNILETSTLLLIIEKVYSTKTKYKDKHNRVLVGYLIFTLITYLTVKNGGDLFVPFNLSIGKLELISIIDIVLLMITYKKTLLCIEKSNNEYECINFKIVNKVIMLKIFYFLMLIFTNNQSNESFRIYILLEFCSVLETYYIYKISIESNLRSPYIEQIDINKKLEKQNREQEEANAALNNMARLQDEIKKEMECKEDITYKILSSTPNGWIVFDEDNHVKYYNDAIKRIFSHNNLRGISESLKKYIVNYDSFMKTISSIKDNGKSAEFEIHTLFGEYYKCNCSKKIDSNEIVCIIIDISKEKHMLSNLVELKKEYEQLIINIKTPIIIFDEESNIVQVSDAYKEMNSEYTIHENDIDMYNNIMNASMKALSNEELYNKGIHRYRVIDSDKNVHWMEFSITIFYEGSSKYIIVSYSDITYYMDAKKVKNDQEIYRALLDCIPEGIYLEDMETNEYIYINQKFKDIFSLTDVNEENLGICRKDLMRIHPNYEHKAIKTIETVKNGKIANYFGIKYYDIHGNIIDTQVASIPFKINQKIFKLTIIKDLNDVKKLESLKQKILEREKMDLSKMQFFINMSHELKTPLNLIFTSAQLIENLYLKGKIYDDNGVLDKHINLTIQNSYRLIKIINDLIDFTKMESGFYQLRLERKNIVTLVEDITMSVANYAYNNGIDLIFDTNIEELNMLIDVNSIERIILNILSNAIKFTNAGGRIYVNLIHKNERMSITIEDTGIGIPKDKLAHIFDRFNEVNKGFIGNIYGSGIGLSMVKSMVNLIGGNISVESELNIGTKFTIELEINDKEEIEYIEKYDNVSNIERLSIKMNDVYK